MRRILASAVTVLGVAACSVESTEPAAPPVQAASQPIINGVADDTMPAAVFVYNGSGGCTGALFKVDRDNDLAWVLTAAHCVLDENQNPAPAQFVMFTKDYATDPNTVQVSAVRSVYDTRYNSNDSYDFAVVTLQGLPGGDVLPTPLALSSGSDGLRQGDTVTSYGFGVTGFDGQNNPKENSRRNRLQKQIYNLDSVDITYAQSSSGVCFGDSGGPVVASNGKIVGVHSRVGSEGSNPCNGTGISARLSSGLSFVNGVVAADLANLPTPVAACDRCQRNADYGDSICKTKRDKCTGDSDCFALLTCLGAAKSNSASQKCYSDHPDSLGMLYDYASCPCNDLCASECSGTASCKSWAEVKCGAYEPAASARKCAQANCCSELDAASANKAAYVCLQDEDGSGCAGNAAYEAAVQCLEEKCPDGSSSGNASSGGGGGDDDDSGDDDATTPAKKKTTTTTKGCAVAAPGGSPVQQLPASAAVLVGLGVIATLRRKRAAA